MPRTAVTALMVAVATVALHAGAGTRDPHIDESVVMAGCKACHEGHGSSDSPMMGDSQKQVCLRCHGDAMTVDKEKAEGNLSPDAKPTLIAEDLQQPYVHPMTEGAFSRHEQGAVTCSSCHSPHRSARRNDEAIARRGPSPSTRNPGQYEYELCLSCHMEPGQSTGPALLDARNRSTHPVIAQSRERSPSVKPDMAGRVISCGDCHGSAGGALGPHGSSEKGILRARFDREDGSTSDSAYELCWRCHEPDAVFLESPFVEHVTHVSEKGASCATCHDSHGSVNNRALIRFGGDDEAVGVTPSVLTGRLEFISESPGAGSCYLTCHGYDHAPESYGLPVETFTIPDPIPLGPNSPRMRPTTPRPSGPGEPIRPRVRDPFPP